MVALLIWLCPTSHTGAKAYQHDQGTVFGTYYSIRYQSDTALTDALILRMAEIDASLSMYNPKSTIAVLNAGRDTVWDPWFSMMYETAEAVRLASHGAFDIRVAPLVNGWGFGFKGREQMTPERVAELRAKRDQMDASAIAKGLGCDAVAGRLEQAGIHNYLVDIGGEIVAKGLNAQGNPWRIGINRPIDDSTSTISEIDRVVTTTDLCMATSGNYRRFYYDGGERRSHTIDPRTGYPVQHNLLSATVVAPSCMLADALATACMVLGPDSALDLIERVPDAACFLIVANDSTYDYIQSSQWQLD